MPCRPLKRTLFAERVKSLQARESLAVLSGGCSVLCNAIFAVIGKRIRRLPIRAEDLRQADICALCGVSSALGASYLENLSVARANLGSVSIMASRGIAARSRPGTGEPPSTPMDAHAGAMSHLNILGGVADIYAELGLRPEFSESYSQGRGMRFSSWCNPRCKFFARNNSAPRRCVP